MELSGVVELAGKAVVQFLQIIALILGTMGAVDCTIATLGGRGKVVQAINATGATFSLTILFIIITFYIVIFLPFFLSPYILIEHRPELELKNISFYSELLIFSLPFLGISTGAVALLFIHRELSLHRKVLAALKATFANKKFVVDKLSVAIDLDTDVAWAILKNGLQKIAIALALQLATVIISFGQSMMELLDILEK